LGIGVYSWGFDEIIANVPEVQGTNPHAMCLESPVSWEWMKRILDYVADNFDFDGFHLESSDQRRCECEKCLKYSDVEYFSKINAMCADYIRAKKPEAILMANMSMYMWPGQFVETERDFQAILKMGESLDYLIDGGHFGFFLRGRFRERAFKELKCAFGSSGGIWVYMPQRWDRLRWFLPTLKRSCEHLKEIRGQGADAAEFYMGAAINPGVEMNILCGGKILNDPSREVYDVLCEAVGELYRPHGEETCRKLADIFITAEDAYYDNVNFSEISNELILEPLFGRSPGPPVYLSERGKMGGDVWMTGEGRKAYGQAMESISTDIREIMEHIGDRERLDRIGTCVNNILKDIASFGG